MNTARARSWEWPGWKNMSFLLGLGSCRSQEHTATDVIGNWGKEYMVLRAGVLRIRTGPKGSDLAVLYIFAVGTEVRQLPNCKLQRPGKIGWVWDMLEPFGTFWNLYQQTVTGCGNGNGHVSGFTPGHLLNTSGSDVECHTRKSTLVHFGTAQRIWSQDRFFFVVATLFGLSSFNTSNFHFVGEFCYNLKGDLSPLSWGMRSFRRGIWMARFNVSTILHSDLIADVITCDVYSGNPPQRVLNPYTWQCWKMAVYGIQHKWLS